ncbi:UNKNOWN [Stylonychia lemnae]|uniref:Uncharacterized protein n=1 Tax=Stylonychia lemnae TaxID=5949 RepID=A0A078AJT5_STYLE|nr:UNKNOWN [Stylonychia lemnae]|eukprot:CDW82151.1 UNKNOWN [Stylonychia lemnae]
MKYEIINKEIGNQKLMMKRQLGEYESKIKKLIIEIEEKSKKHIKELNELHEQYIGNKTNEMVLKQRIKQCKMVQQTGQQGQSEAKKEVHRLRLKNDELLERVRFLGQRYNILIHRMGSSYDDFAAIYDFMRQSYLYYNQEDDKTDRQMKNPSKGNKINTQTVFFKQSKYY